MQTDSTHMAGLPSSNPPPKIHFPWRVSLDQSNSDRKRRLTTTTGSFDVAVAVLGLITLSVRPAFMSADTQRVSLAALTVLGGREERPKCRVRDGVEDRFRKTSEYGQHDGLWRARGTKGCDGVRAVVRGHRRRQAEAAVTSPAEPKLRRGGRRLIRSTYGGSANGIPRKLWVDDELAVPVNVPESRTTVGAARVAPEAKRACRRNAAKRTPKLSDIPGVPVSGERDDVYESA
jgi:hypothetical protein